MDRRRAAAALATLALLGGACEAGQDSADGSSDEVPAADDAGTGPEVPPLSPAIDDLDETVVTITTSSGDRVRVDAKVASTSDERRHGLMHVPELPDGLGMLFVFDSERSGGFWMFNTLVPLDIAYIDDAGEIGTIAAMEPCGSDDAADCPTYAPDRPYSTALEVPQGWFDDVGVATGDVVDWTGPVPAG